jgi:hypothetical protein
MGKIQRMVVHWQEEEIPKTLNQFKNWEFTSGSAAGEDFREFSRLFREAITKSLPAGAKLVKFNSGHYYCSGFIQMDSKFAYFSISDVRHFSGDWHKHILIRSAESLEDYHGGTNHYTGLDDFAENVAKLLG